MINMKKIALHIDEKGKVVLLKYKDIDEYDKSSLLRGSECSQYIRKLSKNKIIDVYENPNGKDVTLEYDKYIIELNNYMKLLNKKDLAPILDNIRIYNEKIELQNRKHKKVTRKNKYIKARVMAGGLSLLILSGCVMGMLHKSNKKEDVELSSSNVSDLDDDFIAPTGIETENIIVTTLSAPEEVVKEVVPTVSIDYEDRSDTSKAYTTKAYYSELINKYSNMYGLDSKLVTAIATQERGIHSGIKDSGGATGLMQVQNAIWAGENLSAYNFNTKTVETITVDEKSLSYVDYNIRVGCMILQTVLKYMNYNTLAAVQCYNMGYGSMDKILNAYSVDSGKSVNEILNDVTDTNWMDYRNIIKKGDPEYIEEVFSWLGNDIELTNKKDDGSQVCFNINTLEQTKTIR